MPYVCWVAIPTSQNMNQVKIIKLFQTRLSERQRFQHVLGKESEFPFYYWGGGGGESIQEHTRQEHTLQKPATIIQPRTGY